MRGDDAPSANGSDRGTMSSNQWKQLMTKGFLYCAVVLVLAICGIAPATAQFPPLPHFQRHRRKLSLSPAQRKARRLLRLQAQSPEIGAVNSPRSAAKRPINSSSSSGPRGAETKYPDLDCAGKLTRVGASKS